eukprot:SAG11_NODE_11252_length_773_cov_3.430267_1_plen_77_part_01
MRSYSSKFSSKVRININMYTDTADTKFSVAKLYLTNFYRRAGTCSYELSNFSRNTVPTSYRILAGTQFLRRLRVIEF